MPTRPKPPARRAAIAPDLGRILRALMGARSLGPKAIADATGIHRTYIHDILDGSSVPTVARLESICAALGVHPADLYDPAATPAESHS